METKTRPAQAGDILRQQDLPGGGRARITVTAPAAIPPSGNADTMEPVAGVELRIELPATGGRFYVMSPAIYHGELAYALQDPDHRVLGEPLSAIWGQYVEADRKADRIRWQIKELRAELLSKALAAAEAELGAIAATLGSVVSAHEAMVAAAEARRARSYATVPVLVGGPDHDPKN